LRLSIILPTYNEERTIRQILDGVLSASVDLPGETVEKEVIVVDDASSDRTAQIIGSDPRVKLVRHEKNQGKGAAIHTGLGHVTGDVVLIQDADMEYSVEDYPALLRPFVESGAEVVYGSRFLKRRWPTGMHWSNYLANRLLTLMANVLYGAKITDEATCYKLFRAALIKSLPLRATGFEFCPEVTALVRLRHVPIYEVPIEYKGRRHAEGKKVRWTDGIKSLLTLLRYRIRRA